MCYITRLRYRRNDLCSLTSHLLHWTNSEFCWSRWSCPVSRAAGSWCSLLCGSDTCRVPRPCTADKPGTQNKRWWWVVHTMSYDKRNWKAAEWRIRVRFLEKVGLQVWMKSQKVIYKEDWGRWWWVGTGQQDGFIAKEIRNHSKEVYRLRTSANHQSLVQSSVFFNVKHHGHFEPMTLYKYIYINICMYIYLHIHTHIQISLWSLGTLNI